MFETSCFRCHTGERPKAGLRLDSLDSVLKGSREGRVIIPGESEHSALVIAVARLDEESAMPPKGRTGGFRGGPGRTGGGGGPQPTAPSGGGQQSHGGPGSGGPQPPKPLTVEQVSLIRAWVDQGAK
jgi:cytochrome c